MKFKKTIVAPLIAASVIMANFGGAFAEKRNESANEISEVKILEITSESKDTPEISSSNSPQTVQNDLSDEASPLLSTDADSQKDLEIIPKSEDTNDDSSTNLPQTVQNGTPEVTTIPSSPNKKESISRNVYGLINVVKNVVNHPFSTIFEALGISLFPQLLTDLSFGISFKIGFIVKLAELYINGYINAPAD